MSSSFLRLRAIHERLRLRLMPQVARFALNHATRRARRTLSTNTPLGVLIDNTILDIAITHESKWITHSLGGYVARVPVHGQNNTSDRHLQASCLASIAHLARSGFLSLHQSAELEVERMTQPSGRFRGYGYADYSLLRDIEFDSIDGWASILASKQQKRKRLRESNDPLFNSLFELLKQQCGEKCSQDVWHIRTAERHGMLCFLTTDKTLLKAYKSLIHKEPLRSLTTRVMSPEELAVYLEIRPVKPHLLSYNDADGPVQMDHTMPEERRRKGSKYR